MSAFEVPEPILNSPYEEPREHWQLAPDEPPRRAPGRRRPEYLYRPPGAAYDPGGSETPATRIELKLVTRVRAAVRAWRERDCPGASRTTRLLFDWWRREGRERRLFFAQLEAAETIVFLVEAREDLLQGLDVPLDEPSVEQRARGARAFRRLACKMATGTGKTTVMGMLAAWSILNKLANRRDVRFSDSVLVVCPNATIRSRLRELDPREGEASIYRARDLVPPHLMPELQRGRVWVTNWHVFEPQMPQVGGVGARVLRAGQRVVRHEVIHLGERTTKARGARYMTPAELDARLAAGLLEVRHEERDEQGRLLRVEVRGERFEESDRSVVARVLGRELRGKSNILVINDEAHHAYRIRRAQPEPGESDEYEDDDEIEDLFKEATVWVEGLDRVHAQRGINLCLDFSATPYFLGRVGQDTHRPFPWVVSDFGLTEAIESGLVKIPQLAVRDTSGDEIPGYANIWRWLLPRLTPAERGGTKGSPKPEAVLKWAHTPLAMLGALWEQELRRSRASPDPRPPVFIVVCKNTRIAKVVHEWLALDRPPHGIPPAGIESFRNTAEHEATIRVDTRVVHETDSGHAKSDADAWMRVTLDTVGKTDWPRDRQGRALYPAGFEELAARLKRPLHPPGRDVRCIVSVGLLTEGWDCNTVTHIIGLRPFMSQLLCEQVVGRGLRRFSYDIGADGRLSEEVVRVLGVPFEVVPFKQAEGGPAPEALERRHVRALPERARLELRFPRVEGYRQAVRNRVSVDWDALGLLRLDPHHVPTEVELQAALPLHHGRGALSGPGRLEALTLNPYRAGRRPQELAFQLAADLTRAYLADARCELPPQVLFPQLARIAATFLREKVQALPPAEVVDVFLSPYYGWAIERLCAALRPDVDAGELPEYPRHERNRGPGSTADVGFWTTREVREVRKSHVNLVVADTLRWEQSAAYLLDTHPRVETFVKNAGLGFAIPYPWNGEAHEYQPDFLVRLRDPLRHVVLEIKGHDERLEAKRQAAQRWVAAVNADAAAGRRACECAPGVACAWVYLLARHPAEIGALLGRA